MIIFYDNQTGQILGTVDGFATYRHKDVDDADAFLAVVDKMSKGQAGVELKIEDIAETMGQPPEKALRMASLAQDKKQITEYLEWRDKLSMNFSHIPDSRVSKLEVGLEHPLEGLAREFEDPRNSKNVYDFALGKDEKGKRLLAEKKDVKNGKIDAKAKQKYAINDSR